MGLKAWGAGCVVYGASGVGFEVQGAVNDTERRTSYQMGRVTSFSPGFVMKGFACEFLGAGFMPEELGFGAP